MIPLQNIDAIIFDIGNVLIDIDYEVMVGEFSKIASEDFRQIITYGHQDLVFDQFEKGLLSAAQFRDSLRKYLRPEVNDDQIDMAWNSILIHYPPAKFELLKTLRKRYRIFALSNINELHAAAIDRQVRERFGEPDMGSFFDRAYYSHELGLRKPEKQIYEIVLSSEGLMPSRTLFIDDKRENTDAAATLGICVYHLENRDRLNFSL